MRQLVEAGLIECVPMSQFRSKYWHEKGLMNLICDVNGRTKVYRLSESVRASLGKRWATAGSSKMLTHQVMVGKIRETLEKTLPEPKFSYDPTEAIRFNPHSGNKQLTAIPDLVCHINGTKVAIEIERKARRGAGLLNPAYEDRFDRLSLQYDAVLFVMEDLRYIHKLMEKANGRAKIGFASVANPQEVYRLGHDPVKLEDFIHEHAKEIAA
jgi:hypothetical protein